MAHFLPLFAIAVTHEFHGEFAVPDLRFEPTTATTALMQRERLLVRRKAAGIEIWREQFENRPDDISPDALCLSFGVFSNDPLMRFYTEWPVAVPVVFKNKSPSTNATKEVLQAVPLADVCIGSSTRDANTCQSSLQNQMKQPVFAVDIEFTQVPAADENLETAQPPTSYVIALKSKKIHWKYFFSGSLAAKKLSIVDLDASENAKGIRFIPSSFTASDPGTAYLSESALPIQKLPRQRLQLREEGRAGKVLIRRLPNASIEKLGKERGPDGQSMIVAEIYIHQ